MPRSSRNGLNIPGIQIDKNGFYWATLAGEYTKSWYELHPAQALPRRKAKSLPEAIERQRQLINALLAEKFSANPAGLDRHQNPVNDNLHDTNNTTNELSDESTPTVAQCVREYIDGKRKIGKGTLLRYNQLFENQIKRLSIATIPISQVNETMAIQCVNELSKLPRLDKPNQFISIHVQCRTLDLLSPVINKAVKKGLLRMNPFKEIELPSEEDYQEPQPMTVDEVKKFLFSVEHYYYNKDTQRYESHRLFALWYLAIYNGLRLGEFLGLRWSDVNLRRNTITINRQINLDERKPPKRHSRRTVVITSTNNSRLRGHHKLQDAEQFLHAPGWNGEGLVFCSENGTPLGPSNLWRTFNALQRRAGLTKPCQKCQGTGRRVEMECPTCQGHGTKGKFRFHDLRHTYAALCIAAGVDVFTLSKRMGHSSVKVTLDIYGHLYEGATDDADAVERLLTEEDDDAIPS